MWLYEDMKVDDGMMISYLDKISDSLIILSEAESMAEAEGWFGFAETTFRTP